MLPIINLRLPSCQPNTPGPCRERFEENAELWQSTRDRAERIRVSVLRSRYVGQVLEPSMQSEGYAVNQQLELVCLIFEALNFKSIVLVGAGASRTAFPKCLAR